MQPLSSDLDQLQGMLVSHPAIFVALMIWSVAWKGTALWKSAQLSHRRWFIAILILNTVGIIEIIYLYFVAKKYSVEVEEK